MTTPGPILQTDRLILRPFAPDDLEAFAAINADAQVMRHFPETWSAARSAQVLEHWATRWQAGGPAFSAVEDRATGALLGMCGLSRPEGLPISPCTEVGWRLTPSAWGKGIATEAARAWLAWGWEQGLAEILAFAPEPNMPSRAVMARIGMVEVPALGFAHPDIPEGHPLRRMVVARIERPGRRAGR